TDDGSALGGTKAFRSSLSLAPCALRLSSIPHPTSHIFSYSMLYALCSMAFSIPYKNSHNEMKDENGHLEPKITRLLATQKKINRYGKNVKIYD
ncbi:MAG: hypothetical protein PVI17_14885, partial [Syntrophobacterales bacterium]